MSEEKHVVKLDVYLGPISPDDPFWDEPREEFLKSANWGLVSDREAYAHPIRDGQVDTTIKLIPSERRHWPTDFTHVRVFRL